MLNFLNSLFTPLHLLAVTGIFVLLGQVLSAVANFLQGMGEAIPGWIGTGISWSGSIVHFLNGNNAAASGK